jgi:phosphoribosyl 1,2-cyclic phosphodiesterase
MSELELIVRGTRGSMSVSGEPYLRYGGNTTCFQLPLPNRQVIFDCGTGLRTVQHEVGSDRADYTVFLTHYHWDHLQGIPVFAPYYSAGNRFEFFAPAPDSGTVADVIDTVIRPPWFPVRFSESPAEVSCHVVPAEVEIGPVLVRSIDLHHPDPVVGYRIDGPDRSVVIATDHEAGIHEVDARLVAFAEGADVLIHDAQYTPEDYVDHRVGWGHSTWEHAVKTAEVAGVGELILTSHDPDHDDAAIDKIEADARAVFTNTTAVYEGMRIPL